MRYWYLKGGDVLGPLSAQEIAKDSDFSNYALVCPEPNSADESFWKTPEGYAEDFGPFLKQVPLPAAANPAPVKTQPAASTPPSNIVHSAPAKEVKIPAAKPLTAPAVEIAQADLLSVSPEETIHTQSPLIAAQEDNILEELPAKALLAKEKTEEPPKEEVKADEPVKEQPHPADPLIAVIENQKPLQSFREEDFTLVSSPKTPAKAVNAPAKNDKEGTIFKPKQESAAPVVIKAEQPALKAKVQPAAAEPKAIKVEPKAAAAVETFTAGSGVVHIKQDGEDVPAPQPVNQKNNGHEKSFFSSMAEEKSYTALNDEGPVPFPFGGEMQTASVSDLIKEEPSSPFLQVSKKPATQNHAQQPDAEEEEEPLIPAATGDRVMGGIMPTTNGKIISSSDGRLEEKKPKNDVIYLLIISMFVFTGIALFMTFFGNNKGAKKTNKPAVVQTAKQQEETKPVVQGVREGVVSPEVQLAQAAAATPVGDGAVKTPDIGHDKGAIVQQDNEADKIKAQEIVKKYLLDEQRGTIAEYFDKTYVSAGYQGRWTANPLYANIYVVDYTATKMRAEPIAYLFKVDIQKGVLSAGLNGISMDLIGLK